MNQYNRHIDFTDLRADRTGTQDFLHEVPEIRQEAAERHQEDKSASPDPDKLRKKVRVKELIDGTFLARENVIRQLPYVLFLTFLGVIYIGNRFHAERMVRQINDLKIEVGNLRSEQITITSELMNISRPSEVATLVESKGLGLKESLVPPKKLKR
jgi:hypothetical protein